MPKQHQGEPGQEASKEASKEVERINSAVSEVIAFVENGGVIDNQLRKKLISLLEKTPVEVTEIEDKEALEKAKQELLKKFSDSFPKLNDPDRLKILEQYLKANGFSDVSIHTHGMQPGARSFYQDKVGEYHPFMIWADGDWYRSNVIFEMEHHGKDWDSGFHKIQWKFNPDDYKGSFGEFLVDAIELFKEAAEAGRMDGVDEWEVLNAIFKGKRLSELDLSKFKRKDTK